MNTMNRIAIAIVLLVTLMTSQAFSQYRRTHAWWDVQTEFTEQMLVNSMSEPYLMRFSAGVGRDCPLAYDDLNDFVMQKLSTGGVQGEIGGFVDAPVYIEIYLYCDKTHFSTLVELVFNLADDRGEFAGAFSIGPDYGDTGVVPYSSSKEILDSLGISIGALSGLILNASLRKAG